MFSLKSPPRYSSIEDPDYDEELKVGGHQDPSLRHSKFKISLCWMLVAVFVTCLSIVSVCTLVVEHVLWRKELACTAPPPAPARVSCSQPAIRREWRTLSKADKNDYIVAVKCLGTKESKLRDNGTLYDDFPWVHKLAGANVHAAAPFFPWHRYYIHAYEKALKDECAYTGNLPYWDWSKDWEDFENAPVWDSETGFGGNGDASGELSVGDGRCVTRGPFAGHEASFYDGIYQPHCLSRGFRSADELSDLGKLIEPEVVERILHAPDFKGFALEMEARGHRFMSESIRGDFSKYTGPNDPVFFLHHTNLDRLWSAWQQNDPHRTTLAAYNGRASNYTTQAASLTDVLDLGGLLESVPVSEVMETTSGMFCYRY